MGPANYSYSWRYSWRGRALLVYLCRGPKFYLRHCWLDRSAYFARVGLKSQSVRDYSAPVEASASRPMADWHQVPSSVLTHCNVGRSGDERGALEVSTGWKRGVAQRLAATIHFRHLLPRASSRPTPFDAAVNWHLLHHLSRLHRVLRFWSSDRSKPLYQLRHSFDMIARFIVAFRLRDAVSSEEL